MDAPIRIYIESGPVRVQQILGAERLPVLLGLFCGVMMCVVALYGQPKAFYGLPLVFLWLGLWRLVATKDPQYGAVMWRQAVQFPWPSRLAAAPGISAPRVKIEPSVPVCGAGPL